MSLTVTRLQLGPVRTNGYVVRSSGEATAAVVIDPGGDAETISATLAQLGAECVGILLTHSHYDHVGALAELESATGAPVWLPEGELDVFAHPHQYFPSVPVPAYDGVSTPLAGGEMVELAGLTFQVTFVPGHSPGHLAYYAEGCLFSGDVLFAGSVGITDLPFGDWDTLLDSIRRLADAYPPETIVYSGHGVPTTLGAELAGNPFLAELRAS